MSFLLGRKGQSRVEVSNGVRVFRTQEREKNESTKFAYLFRILTFFWRASVAVSVKHMRSRYDVVHVHSVPDFLVFAAALPRLTGARLILDIHDLLPELYGTKFGSSSASKVFSVLKIVERVSAAFADHVIAPNHIWRDKLAARSVAARKSSVFMNYPDPNVFRPQGRSRTDDKFVFLYPGTLSWHQGLDIAIRAFAKVSVDVPNSEFRIYGEGPAKESLISLVDELNLGGKVVFHAPVPLREISAVIENADVGIVPKRNDSFGDEAFSTKTLEFMTLELPLILAETTVDRYYFNDDVVTFFPNGDVNALANCMFRLVQDTELRSRQAARARRFVAAYSWDAKKSDYLSLVDDLAKAMRPIQGLAASHADAS